MIFFFQYDLSVSPVDTWRAMEMLVEKGLVKSIGVSNFNKAQIEDIVANAKVRRERENVFYVSKIHFESNFQIKPVTNQVECHPYLPPDKLLATCAAHGITLTAYSPLGSPDRPWAKPGDPSLLADPKLQEIGKRHGKSAAQVLLRWQVNMRTFSAFPVCYGTVCATMNGS